MDTEAVKQQQVPVVLARARDIWPNEAVEEWVHGSNDVLDGARLIDLVRLAKTDEMLVALELARA
jgi:hypothetical protein